MPIAAQKSYVLLYPNPDPPVSKHTLDLHCAVLQKFARRYPPEFDNVRVDAVQTKVGWRQCPDGSVECIFQVSITHVLIPPEMWAIANFEDAGHVATVSCLDLGPWLHERDAQAREWAEVAAIKPMPQATPQVTLPGQTRRFYFSVKTEGGTLSSLAMSVHCAVLQKFVLQQPPACVGAQIDPSRTRVGHLKSQDGTFQVVVELCILALDRVVLAPTVGSHLSVDTDWVAADFSKREHCAMADALDVFTWFKFQDARARKWIKATSAQKVKSVATKASF